jgi:hypothetical protein
VAGTNHTTQSPLSDHETEHSSSSKDPLPSVANTSDTCALLLKIRALANNLPKTVELAVPSSPWASLFVGAGAGDDAYIAAFKLTASPNPLEDWEVCNQSIHKCFDYGITKEALATRIRRGPMGILALSGFLDFMKKRGVDLTPLQGRLQLLIDALHNWYVIIFHDGSSTL